MMFKRALWIGSGFGLGVGSSWWVKRTVARKVSGLVDDLVPAAVRNEVTGRVRAAVSDGRSARADFEAQANADLGV